MLRLYFLKIHPLCFKNIQLILIFHLKGGWLPMLSETNDSNSEEYNGQSLNKQTFHHKDLYLALSGYPHYYGSLPEAC